jgi:hypothetical protein
MLDAKIDKCVNPSPIHDSTNPSLHMIFTYHIGHMSDDGTHTSDDSDLIKRDTKFYFPTSNCLGVSWHKPSRVGEKMSVLL